MVSNVVGYMVSLTRFVGTVATSPQRLHDDVKREILYDPLRITPRITSATDQYRPHHARVPYLGVAQRSPKSDGRVVPDRPAWHHLSHYSEPASDQPAMLRVELRLPRCYILWRAVQAYSRSEGWPALGRHPSMIVNYEGRYHAESKGTSEEDGSTQASPTCDSGTN